MSPIESLVFIIIIGYTISLVGIFIYCVCAYYQNKKKQVRIVQQAEPLLSYYYNSEV
jgi:hypothetical protein